MKKVIKYIILVIIIIVVCVTGVFLLRQNFFKFDRKLTSEEKEIIERYINDNNTSNLEEGMTFASTYYFGSRLNNDELNVYLWTVFEEYDVQDDLFLLNKEINNASIITIDVSDDKFEITSYTILDNDNDIKKDFPIAIRNVATSFKESKEYSDLEKENDQMIDTYKEYFKESE